MTNEIKNGLKIGLSIMVFAIAMAMAALSMSNYLVTASFYGEGADRPDTKEELCAFLEDKLASNSLSTMYRRRYEKDKALHCKVTDTLHGASLPVVDTSLFGQFLHGPRSGADVMNGSNNYLSLLMNWGSSDSTSTTTNSTENTTYSNPSTTQTTTPTETEEDIQSNDDGGIF
ncbi:hypothetical protein IT411_02950 [Candidatus Peregrinibacteria bacterium]|nr:hypothetical protein [Candidatus Peregrinibacteria bacterium]